ncbi:MAG: hypothetical protein JW755_09420 [Candidatus Aminicenantes bacterium]|nr:hypothetical protein [Candidatus Aminicenantes bacterium]
MGSLLGRIANFNIKAGFQKISGRFHGAFQFDVFLFVRILDSKSCFFQRKRAQSDPWKSLSLTGEKISQTKEIKTTRTAAAALKDGVRKVFFLEGTGILYD